MKLVGKMPIATCNEVAPAVWVRFSFGACVNHTEERGKLLPATKEQRHHRVRLNASGASREFSWEITDLMT
jgi:hypothetical protein